MDAKYLYAGGAVLLIGAYLYAKSAATSAANAQANADQNLVATANNNAANLQAVGAAGGLTATQYLPVTDTASNVITGGGNTTSTSAQDTISALSGILSSANATTAQAAAENTQTTQQALTQSLAQAFLSSNAQAKNAYGVTITPTTNGGVNILNLTTRADALQTLAPGQTSYANVAAVNQQVAAASNLNQAPLNVKTLVATGLTKKSF
jgi:hypothetical protein